MNQEELLRLFGAFSDGTISEEEHGRLQEQLRASAEARRLWFLFNDIETGLAGRPPFELDPGIRIPANVVPVRWTRFVPWAIAAAVALFFGILQLAPKQREPEPFLSLTASTKASWADPNVELSLMRGELPLGMLHLASGLAEFRFSSGATMLVEGPAEFQPLGGKRVFMKRGKLWCSCPGKESQVTVITREAEITDLGTEFAVIASEDGATQVKVISGEVKVEGRESLRIKTGQLVEVRRDRVIQMVPLKPGDFPSAPAMLPGGSGPGGENIVKDPGFEDAQRVWNGSEPYTELAPGKGRAGNGVRISAKGSGLWPLVGQTVATGDLSGQIVRFSAWGMHPSDDPLKERQCAILKLSFLDSQLRVIATAERRFLFASEPRDQFVRGEVAAIAPEETASVKVQVLLNANGNKNGSAYFDDTELVVIPRPRVGLSDPK